jgi:HK97 family phage major capsid protein
MASDAELKELHNELRRTHEDLKEYIDNQVAEHRGELPQDKANQLEELNNKVGELQGAYDEMRKSLEQPDGSLTFPGGGEGSSNPEDEVRAQAFEKYMRFGAGENGRQMMSEEEVRALSGTSDQDGGYMVPTDFESTVLTKAYNMAELRPLCQVGTTGRDSVFMGALSKPSVAWGRRNLAVSEQDLQTGGERIDIFDLRTLILIHNNTLDDSQADLWGEILDQVQMAIAEAEDDAFAAGPGDGEPQGIIADSRIQNSYSKNMGASWIDTFIEALYSLKKTYRRNATWAMNSTVEADVRKLKDNDGQYLWQPPVQAGAPATLLGRPMVNPEGLPDAVSNAYPVIIGDFRAGYKIRDRAGLTVQRLTERYAEYDQTGFLVKRRTGGQVVMPEAFRIIQS